MKHMKKVFRLIVCMVLLASMALGTFAAPIDYLNNDTGEYLTFTPSVERIDSNGDFTFRIRIEVKSNVFYATSDKLRIDTSAMVYNEANKSYTKDNTVLFRMTLYTSAGFKVGSYVGDAVNVYGGKTFDVKSGDKYYITLTSLYDFAGTGMYIDGYGKVSPIKLK